MEKINTAFLKEMFEKYNFNINQYVSYKAISKGHINTTYVLYFDYGNKVKRYLLQEINTNVFKEPEKLMNNINLVSKHCEKKLKEYDKNYKNKTLRIYPSKENKSYVILSDNSCWRVYHYVENSVTHDISNDKVIFYQAGQIIGNFQNLLSDFDSSNLYEVIKDFHNTIKRYDFFIKTLENVDKNIINKCQKEISFFIKNKEIACLIQSLIDQKKLPLRVTHNDTKLNNLMFEYKTNQGMCLVDLDTVMPGCICYDYGDFIRSACNCADEDEKDLSKVVFQTDNCLSFTKGYLEKVKKTITPLEVDNLINGAIVMTYECGIRFLTDYLNGNTYFKIDYEDHNLIRCKTQIHLCKQLIQNKEFLENKISEIYKNVA